MRSKAFQQLAAHRAAPTRFAMGAPATACRSLTCDVETIGCGFVCRAYAQIWDKWVSSAGIWSSGLLTNYTAANNFRHTEFFFMGGQSDIGYGNGERDYNVMPAGVSGMAGRIMIRMAPSLASLGYWVHWVLGGNAMASEYLTWNGARSDVWSVVSKDLERLDVKPIA